MTYYIPLKALRRALRYHWACTISPTSIYASAKRLALALATPTPTT